MENRKWNLQMLIPLATTVFSLVFIVVGIKDFGFWTNQPTAAFFPIIIASVLLLSSIACFVQLSKPGNAKTVRYNRDEMMVILGAAGILLCTLLVGLVPSCLLYIFLWLKFVEHAPWKAIIVIEIIMAAIILGVFVSWLQVRFPTGLLGSFL
ncbi:tripartite tricarboxylate transporter TctB family protein [Oscillibacter sp.]|uniref:tripartite tricarboxylate transporter TctB family protein n=1 Tax=Oscillibacter sp. TaxID=1945593 RepID=UPI0026040062|nr:tripartite tricarboxylate transporter TctB family protein [Oscillibacter sp.]MDD3347385.1 tripartite tricarboxylate transporter TctB family protein [Oscillibacter sp.]